MGLEQLMDGAICTGVLVEADAEDVAAFLASSPDVSGHDPRVLIADLATLPWCRVELSAEVARSERAYDSDPLLAEAIAAMNDLTTEGPLGVDTPVRTARLLSTRFGTAAIGIWASDQGPGIGGAVRFDHGLRSWCFSAASPQGIELIDRVRELEESESELSEEIEEEFEELDERCEESCWSITGELDGEVSEYVNKALEDLGMDPDWIEEPVWALVNESGLPEEVDRIVRVP